MGSERWWNTFHVVLEAALRDRKTQWFALDPEWSERENDGHQTHAGFQLACEKLAAQTADRLHGVRPTDPPALIDATRQLVLYLNTKIDPKPAELQGLIVVAESALSRSIP